MSEEIQGSAVTISTDAVVPLQNSVVECSGADARKDEMPVDSTTATAAATAATAAATAAVTIQPAETAATATTEATATADSTTATELATATAVATVAVTIQAAETIQAVAISQTEGISQAVNTLLATTTSEETTPEATASATNELMTAAAAAAGQNHVSKQDAENETTEAANDAVETGALENGDSQAKHDEEHDQHAAQRDAFATFWPEDATSYPDDTGEPGDRYMFSGDPKVWGKYFWAVIHLTAFYYPEHPDIETQHGVFNLFESLRFTLPCAICREHYRANWLLFPLREYLASRALLIEWTILLHDHVNESLGVPAFDYKSYLNNLTGTDAVIMGDDEDDANNEEDESVNAGKEEQKEKVDTEHHAGNHAVPEHNVGSRATEKKSNDHFLTAGSIIVERNPVKTEQKPVQNATNTFATKKHGNIGAARVQHSFPASPGVAYANPKANLSSSATFTNSASIGDRSMLRHAYRVQQQHPRQQMPAAMMQQQQKQQQQQQQHHQAAARDGRRAQPHESAKRYQELHVQQQLPKTPEQLRLHMEKHAKTMPQKRLQQQQQQHSQHPQQQQHPIPNKRSVAAAGAGRGGASATTSAAANRSNKTNGRDAAASARAANSLQAARFSKPQDCPNCAKKHLTASVF